MYSHLNGRLRKSLCDHDIITCINVVCRNVKTKDVHVNSIFFIHILICNDFLENTFSTYCHGNSTTTVEVV